MKKHLRRISAIALAMVTILAMCMPTFADDPAVPKSTDTAVIKVENVDLTDSPVVRAYQIVQPVYGEGGEGLVKYEPVIADSIADVNEPTMLEITALAGQLDSLGTPIEMALGTDDKTFEAEVGAGTYLVIVAGTGATLYNPMIVSAYYNEDSEIVSDESADAKARYDIGLLEGETGYAKSSTPDIEKIITGHSASDGLKGPYGDDIAYGDTFDFSIENAVIPDYSDAYDTDTLVYNLTDKMDAGLELVEDSVEVFLGGEALDADGAYEIKYDDDMHGFVVEFVPAWIKANAHNTVSVTYSATLLETAATNFDPNKNIARVDYTDKPGTTTYGKTHTTYQYTFEIDGNLCGQSPFETYQPHEIVKVDDKGDITQVIDEWNELVDFGESGVSPLEGAIFTLTNDDSGKVYTSTTDENGMMNFKGLDAGTYTLVETQAPKGYSLSTEEHAVVVDATYYEDGQLESYTITVDGVASSYTATYEGEVIQTILPGDNQTTFIKNTPLKKLPSTGGIGTYIFTFLGVVILGVAAGLFFYDRKRRAA